MSDLCFCQVIVTWLLIGVNETCGYHSGRGHCLSSDGECQVCLCLGYHVNHKGDGHLHSTKRFAESWVKQQLVTGCFTSKKTQRHCLKILSYRRILDFHLEFQIPQSQATNPEEAWRRLLCNSIFNKLLRNPPWGKPSSFRCRASHRRLINVLNTGSRRKEFPTSNMDERIRKKFVSGCNDTTLST